MATEAASQNGSTEETSGQEQQGQQGQTTPESGANGSTPQPTTPVIDKSTKLPDDHPLVTAHSTVKEKLAKHVTELAEARAQAAKATQLQAELDKRPTPEALTQLQTRYDRLEAFLQQAGGDLGRALDSRTFTRQLFETDAKVEDLVKAWHKAHPSATSQALGGGSAAGQGVAKQDPNELIRAAWNGSKN